MEAVHDEPLSPPGVYRPRSLEEAWEIKRTLGGDAVYVSGGTLLRTQWEAGTVPYPKQLIDLRSIEGLKGITMNEFGLSVGALTTLAECRKDGLLGNVFPAVQEAVRCIAAPPVRNLATIGGNISSGIGDVLPALLVSDAEFILFDGNLVYTQPAQDWLNSRWGTAHSSAEILTEIRLAPLEEPQQEDCRRFGIFRKVGRRETFTASLVTIAITFSADPEGRLSDVRIAAGGGSGRPHRLGGAEALLEGNLCNEEMLASIYNEAVNSFETYSDPFATEAYKKKTAGNLIVSELWKAFNQG